MGDKNFTLLELHFAENSQFSPAGLADFLRSGDTDRQERSALETEDEDDGAAADSDSSGRSAVGAVIGLVALVAIAVAAKKFRGGEDEEDSIEREDEPDVIVN